MTLDARALDAFLGILHDATGMDFNEGRAKIVETRIEERIAALEIADWTLYRGRLTTDPEELHRLIEAVAVNETFFFRHPQQFDVIRRVLLPRLAAESRETRRPVRIWSAACASGCEAYSLAICCLETAAWSGDFPFEIIATDIDAKALEEAAAGVYGERAVKLEMPPELLARHFRLQSGAWRVRDAVRSRVRFMRLNFVSDIYPTDCDIVFCRNVLYYFSDEVRDAILRRIWRALPPNRYIALSPTEPLRGFEAWFRPADGMDHVMESWTTDRRHTAALVGRTGSSERRKERAWSEIHGAPRTLILAGAVGANVRPKMLRHELTMALGRVGDSEAILDCSRLQWISNEALHELKLLLTTLRGHNMIRILGAHFANETHAEWFRLAGFAPLLRKIDVLSRVNVTAIANKPAAPPAPMPRPRAASKPKPPETATSRTSAVVSRPVSATPSPPATVAFPEMADAAALPSIRSALAAALERADAGTDVVIELHACRFAGDVVLRTLARAISSAAGSHRFVLSGASAALRRAVERHLPALRGAVAWSDAAPAAETSERREARA